MWGRVGAGRGLGLVAVLAAHARWRRYRDIHGPIADVVLREVELGGWVPPERSVVLVVGVGVGGERGGWGRLVGIVAGR